MNRLRSASIGAFAVAALTYPSLWALERFAVEAWLITPHHPQKVEVNRGLFLLDAPGPSDRDYPRKVMEVYGNPTGEPVRVLFVPRGRFVHPPELPSLTLLTVEKEKGENPLQVQTLRFLSARLAGGASLVGGLLFGLGFLLQRRRTPA